MDVLSDIFERVEIRSRLQTSPELIAPWGFEFPEQSDCAKFYVVSRGNCYLKLAGSDTGADVPLPLVGGDLIFLPHGTAHSLRDHPRSVAIPFSERSSDCPRTGALPDAGGDSSGERTILVGGHFSLVSRTAAYLLSTLPPLIHIRADDTMSVPWLEATLRFLTAESLSLEQGSQLITARLTDVLLVQILRAYVAQTGKRKDVCTRRLGFLRALVDPEIGRALTFVHKSPAHPWTVAELARQLGMSRTGFAVRFTDLAGVAPMQYLTLWRMDLASTLLRSAEDGLEEISRKVGYESAAAFSKAFKRELGVSPGSFRRDALASSLT